LITLDFNVYKVTNSLWSVPKSTRDHLILGCHQYFYDMHDRPNWDRIVFLSSVLDPLKSKWCAIVLQEHY
jgi:hypothetical protein